MNKKTLETLFSSKQMDWATPRELFNNLDNKFHFTLDAAADDTNHKCAKYFTKDDNALIQKWSGRVWLNSPYGRSILKWIKKVKEEMKNCEVIVCLLPSRTGTTWFQDYCMKYAEVWFLKGRIKFVGMSNNSAPFDSIIAIFGKGHPPGTVKTYDLKFTEPITEKGLW